MVDTSKRDEIVNALEKRYAGTILRGDEVDSPSRIPTGSLELDYITEGGIPMGRWTRMYGGYSSTKTRTCWEIVRQAQKMGLECVYYNVEKQFDVAAANRAGVDTAELTLVQGTTIEETAEKMESLLGVAHLHIIDSCSNAVSVDELNADLTDWRPGLMARAWGKALRRCHERLGEDNAAILIDQLRMNFGKRGQQATEEPPGGRFLNYLSSMNMNFRRGKWLFYDKKGFLVDDLKKAQTKKTLSGALEPDGREITVRCEKSRVGRPELSATLAFDMNEYAFDYDFEYVKALKYLGLVTQSGSWWTYQPNGKKSQKRVQGDAGLRELIGSQNGLREEVYKLVMESPT